MLVFNSSVKGWVISLPQKAVPVLLLSFSYHHFHLYISSHLYLRLLLVPALQLAARGKLVPLQNGLCTHHGKPISSSCPINPVILLRIFWTHKLLLNLFLFYILLGQKKKKEREGVDMADDITSSNFAQMEVKLQKVDLVPAHFALLLLKWKRFNTAGYK